MQKLAIIADDLTGALDTSAPFADEFRVVVATSPRSLDRALALEPDVVAVSTRSREATPAEARAAVALVLDRLPNEMRLFKKVDSRLKGHIAEELSAFAHRPMLVAPAIPDFGRVVRNGQVTGFGVDHPIDIAAALGQRRAVIPDVETAAHLSAAIQAAPKDAILVGARGLAIALRGGPGKAAPVLDGPVCIAVGSTDPITLAQIAALQAAFARLHVVTAPAGEVARPGPHPADVTLLHMVPGAASVEPRVAAQRFAKGCAPWLSRARSAVITGGATAEACLDATGHDVLTGLGDVLPGLPAVAAGTQIIVTKSGGFGQPDTFVRLVRMAFGSEA